MFVVLALWVTFAIVFGLTWGVWKFVAWASAPRPPKPPCPEASPPPPTKCQMVAEARLRYAEGLRILDDMPLSESEKVAGRDRVKQRFLKELDNLI